MKIAILWPRFGPYHLARLRGATERCAARGARIVGLEIAQQDHYAWDLREGADGFDRHTVFPEARYDALTSRQIGRGVAQALDAIRPAVVAINGWSVPEARAALAWCRRRGARAVLMSETKWDDGDQRTWWKETIKGWLVRRCDAALVGGRPQADYLQRLGFPHARIFFGYDVVDNDYFARETARVRTAAAAHRARHRLPERYFFACTRFLPRKNIDGLLRAYAAYRAAAGTPWGLVIAGSGEEADALHALQRRLGLDGVDWPGFVQYEQLPVYFGLAAAFIHPAKSEPWGLVVNEAAASGLPLLVSRTVGARYELLAEGDNGFLFDPTDIADIARVLRAMADLPESDRAAMGARSTAVVADWSPTRFGEGLFAAISAAQSNSSRLTPHASRS
ncbi:MAG: glycosyltransferase family 4 protein [Candidatus Competibacter sp.]|nr:glycosyltransferase family 4 protein [Candidatus Competibacter sp.]